MEDEKGYHVTNELSLGAIGTPRRISGSPITNPLLLRMTTRGDRPSTREMALKAGGTKGRMGATPAASFSTMNWTVVDFFLSAQDEKMSNPTLVRGT